MARGGGMEGYSTQASDKTPHSSSSRHVTRKKRFLSGERARIMRLKSLIKHSTPLQGLSAAAIRAVRRRKRSRRSLAPRDAANQWSSPTTRDYSTTTMRGAPRLPLNGYFHARVEAS